MSTETVNSAVRFFREASVDGLTAVQFIFHGGEPLLIGSDRLESIVHSLRHGLSDHVNVSFALQTNATLITDRWVSLFGRHNIAVGVSLDGPKDSNDRHRLTLTSNGSYDAASSGLQKLVNAYERGDLSSVGVLCVVNPDLDPAPLFDHFVDELGVKLLDFLLPDVTHEDALIPGPLGTYLVRLFDKWSMRNDPKIRVRVLSSILSLMLGGRSRMIGFGGEAPFAMTLNVDGTLSPDDTLRNCGHGIMDTGYHVGTSTFSEFVSCPAMRAVRSALLSLPDGCAACEWSSICSGGHLVNRYSPNAHFNNPSVVCSDLKQIYRHVARHVLAHGHEDRLRGALSKPLHRAN